MNSIFSCATRIKKMIGGVKLTIPSARKLEATMIGGASFTPICYHRGITTSTKKEIEVESMM